MAEQQKRKAAAGWYPHPSMADTQRYWDGQKWTDHIAPAGQKPPAATGGGADYRHWGGVLAICAALAVLGLALRGDESSTGAGDTMLALGGIIGVVALLKLGSEMLSRR